MPFQVSPGVNVTEIDLTTVVPAVSSTEGAFAGVFRWGPVNKRVLVSSENELVARFHKPTNFNAETFFTAANFLSYGNKLYVVRAATATIANTTTFNTAFANTDTSLMPYAFSAIANSAALTSNTDLATFTVLNDDLYSTTVDSAFATASQNVHFVARYPGELGNSLKVSVCDTANAFSQTLYLGGLASNGLSYNANISSNAEITTIIATPSSNQITFQFGPSGTGTIAEANSIANTVLGYLNTGDTITIGNSTIGTQTLKVTAKSTITSNSTIAYFTVNTESKYTGVAFGNVAGGNSAVSTQGFGYFTRTWEYANYVDRAPGTSTFTTQYGNAAATDEVHVVVADEDGLITGTRGAVIEVYNALSRATNAKTAEGDSNYIKDVINNNSKYVYYAQHRQGNTYANSATYIATPSNTSILTLSFNRGYDGLGESNVTIATLTSGYDLFRSAEDIDVSLVLQGKARSSTAEGSDPSNQVQLANYLIDNIVEYRKDCVAFVSPNKNTVVTNSAADEALDIVTFRNALTTTSYAVLDSGYKYQYDKYNDIYRWVPLNGDIAGLCVRTDDTRDPWFSPAGFNRGIIKNAIKLAFNPDKAERDVLYKNGVNPVVTFPGQGTLLYGDKTLLAKPSAFDRINVRRLFIVLEKAIATAAKYSLFEFNDEFTRAQFRNLVEPFLRDVQGRRGIYDFRVVCDETNNTGEVIDRNEFVGDIYIKPAKSINFIQLNFVAVRTGVEFSEVVGKF